ncbi:MAG: DUF1667 domain-containing protein [Firmicutes bacterium]|nr:DUF1667 domain-containing protein [Bacillota bacterium]
METREFSCIVCPNGCRITVQSMPESAPLVSGAECPKGITYVLEELANPLRVLTSTVRVTRGPVKVLPVRTASAIPKRSIGECMRVIRTVVVSPPVKCGDVLVEGLASTGVPLVATWSVPES